MALKFARSELDQELGAAALEQDQHGDPWVLLGADGNLTIGFEYGQRTVTLSIDVDGDVQPWQKVLLEAWADRIDRRLRGVRLVWPGGYEGYRSLLKARDVNAEEMYVEATDDWSSHRCVVACPSCSANGKPLVREGTFYVGGGMRWVGLDYQEPYSDYRSRCPRCHAEFRFTIFTPQ